MVRLGRSAKAMCRPAMPCAVLAILVCVASLPARPGARAETKRPPSLADLAQQLAAVAEAQRQADASLSLMREQLDAMQERLTQDREVVERTSEHVAGAVEQGKEMREEVRGLYVESSGLKSDIAQVGQQVEGLGGSLGGFRLSAGIFIAAILVLQIATLLLIVRGRG